MESPDFPIATAATAIKQYTASAKAKSKIEKEMSVIHKTEMSFQMAF